MQKELFKKVRPSPSHIPAIPLTPLQFPSRPKGAEAPSPGHSPWVFMSARLAPCRGKSFIWRPEPQALLLNPSSNWLWNSANYVKM